MTDVANTDLHAPEEYDELVEELVEEVEDGIEADPGLFPDEVVRERVEERVFGAGIERAAFISRNSESHVGDYSSYVGDGTASSVYEAVAFTQLEEDVFSEVKRRNPDIGM